MPAQQTVAFNGEEVLLPSRSPRQLAPTLDSSDAHSTPMYTDNFVSSPTSTDGFPPESESSDDTYDEECGFTPKVGHYVWVKSKDIDDDVIWYRGCVQKETLVVLQEDEIEIKKFRVHYVTVRYHKILAYFSPLLGDIKPDTPEVCQSLMHANCRTFNGLYAK